MADPMKYDNPSESGNVFGAIPSNPDSQKHNGRTPVNAAAESEAPITVLKTMNNERYSGYTPSEA